MELPRRQPNDVYLPDGEFSAILRRLSAFRDAADLRILVASAFDYRTRMLPYWYADKRMAPCSVRTLGDALDAAGFKHVRVVLQQWTPNVRASAARLDGRPIDLLLVSAMQVHAEPSYELIRDAHTMGAQRPLIIAGGPKAIYEPADYFELGPKRGVGADCVVTGEVYVLLDLLERVLEYRASGESLRSAFERARDRGALDSAPGLVYPRLDSSGGVRVAVSTGVQRLLRDLDEMPLPIAGYRLLEPPHRGRELSPAPLAANRVRRRSPIASLTTTRGCKFNCSFCPIPAANQRTWRHKSPERFAEEVVSLQREFGLKSFFGTDDNFFNRRETVESMMRALERVKQRGPGRHEHPRFYTEATAHDVYKNRDMLPFCRKAGLRGIWFGIEDISAELVNKGQTAAKTKELFSLLIKLGIQPMAMMIHSDDQPLRSEKGTLRGLINQAKFLYEAGAVSYQCTYLGPAIGTRDVEDALRAGTMYRKVGGKTVPQAFYDGNHVVASRHPRPWEKQVNVLRAYASFYNPINLLRTFLRVRRGSVAGKRFVFQLIGHIGLVLTVPRLLAWARTLRRGPIEYCSDQERARIPLVDVETGGEIQWAIQRAATPELAPSGHGMRMPILPTGHVSARTPLRTTAGAVIG